MSNIIQFPTTQEKSINVQAVQSSARKLKAGLIAPATENTTCELAAEHTSEPIKSMDDIIRISRYLIDNKRYRDNMLFIVGINFGLRVSDLRMLQFSHLINTAVVEAVTLYLENTPNVKLNDYLFRSESNHGAGKNQPVHRNTIDNIMKCIAEDLGLGNKMSTHSLRKTFAYHQMVMSGNDPRKLLLLQKMFGHSTAAQTLDYIGITGEEIDEAYRNLNLGSATCNYLVDSSLMEGTDQSAG